MALRQTKKISELPALSPASLDTTFVVGISGSTTYKISINNLTSSLDTTFATDLVTSALSNTLDTKLSTSSFNSYTASISTGSLVTSISNLNIFTASVTTASIVTSITNLNTFSSSIYASWSADNSFIRLSLPFWSGSVNTSITNLNTYTASQSTSSLVDRLNTIESVSGSWITESETGSFATTGSNTFIGEQIISSSLIVTNEIKGIGNIFLQPDVNDARYFQIYNTAAPSGNDIHFKGNTDFNYFGDDTNYLKIDDSAQTITITGVNGVFVSSSLNATSITGSIAATNGVISGSTQLTTAFPSKTTGAWSVPAGASTQSFTVEAGASYTMWVNGNIPNGIITWNATVTTSNTNVPAVGSQYGWYYTAGNALVLTAMPDQIIGTSNTLISSPTSYAPNTSNVFKFGITNNSATTQTINYGYIKLS
jgi:hypothetical protein